MKETETWHQYCALRKTQGEIYSVAAMTTSLAPVSFSFEQNVTICDSITSEKRTCPKHTLCPYGVSFLINNGGVDDVCKA